MVHGRGNQTRQRKVFVLRRGGRGRWQREIGYRTCFVDGDFGERMRYLESQSAVSVNCTIFQAKQITYHAPAPHRVILGEAAPPAKNHAHPPIIAAQSNPAPSGAPAGGISLAKRYSMKQRTTERSLPPGGEGGAPAPDEGEIGERNHVMQSSRRSSLPLRGGRWREAPDEGETGERTT